MAVNINQSLQPEFLLQIWPTVPAEVVRTYGFTLQLKGY